MRVPVNTFKAGLASKEPRYGLFVGLPGTSNAEILGAAGFDWLIIDHEHAPFELADILCYLQALAPYAVAPIVRPVDHNPALLKKLLDIGVQTFVVPMVDDAAQAAALVSALRYPPQGNRGLGASLARAARWGQVDDYLHTANAQICLIVQAESVAAINNLDDILAVDGVDGVFIGPSDLSASMGYVGKPEHPDVVETISAALQAISAAGKCAGVLSINLDMAAHYQSCGANFIGVGVDTLLLGNSAAQLATTVAKGIES